MTRRELIEAVGQRYREASPPDKPAILDEFVNVTGYHRKHAIRLLRKQPSKESVERQAPKCIYDEAVREALILVSRSMLKSTEKWFIRAFGERW